MDDMLGGASRAPRLPKASLAAALAVGAIAAIVAYTHTGLDILALALLVLLVVIIERTIGDWFAELMGPALSSTVLAAAAGLCVWQLLAGGGRETTYTFFAAAEHRGYRSLYLNQALDYASRSTSGLRPASTTGVGDPATADSGPMSRLRPSPSARSASAPVSRSHFAVDSVESAKDRIARDLSKMLVLKLPSRVETGQAVPISVVVANPGRQPAGGRVEFLMDDRVVASADIRPDGTAATELIAPASGKHTVRVRLASAQGIGSSTATLVVLPSR